MTSRISAAAAAALLAACSSDGSTERTSRAVYESATAVFRPAPEIVAPTDRPYVVIGYGGVRTPMALIGRRDGFERYEGVGGVEMTLQNGFLVRLRGLGRELEAIYLAESGSSPDLAARARRGENLERKVDYWEKGAPRREVFLCALSARDAADNRTNVTEKCRSIYGDEQFVNLYILNSDGGLVISQQWFHPEADAIIIEHELN